MDKSDSSSRAEEKRPAQSQQAQGIWWLKEPELALGLMAGRKMAWHKPIVTRGLILAAGREAKLRKRKKTVARERLAPPPLRRPHGFGQALGLKGV